MTADTKVKSLSSRRNVVKIRPHMSNKTSYFQICVGSNIARELEWKDGDSINVMDNSTKDFIFLQNMGKTNDSHWKVKGYVFRKMDRCYCYSINLPYKCFDEGFAIKIAQHEIIKKNKDKFLKVYLFR